MVIPLQTGIVVNVSEPSSSQGLNGKSPHTQKSPVKARKSPEPISSIEPIETNSTKPATVLTREGSMQMNLENSDLVIGEGTTVRMSSQGDYFTATFTFMEE